MLVPTTTAEHEKVRIAESMSASNLQSRTVFLLFPYGICITQKAHIWWMCEWMGKRMNNIISKLMVYYWGNWRSYRRHNLLKQLVEELRLKFTFSDSFFNKQLPLISVNQIMFLNAYQNPLSGGSLYWIFL